MIVAINHYYAKPGCEADVLAQRLKACDVRTALGLPRGRVLLRAALFFALASAPWALLPLVGKQLLGSLGTQRSKLGLKGRREQVLVVLVRRGRQGRAKLALDYFVYRIALFAGMLTAAMGGSLELRDTPGGGLTALNIETGKKLWFAQPAPCAPARPGCSPAQSAALTAIPGAVFSGSLDGHLRAFASADGKLLWQHPWASSMVQPALIADGDLLISALGDTSPIGTRRIAVARGAGSPKSGHRCVPIASPVSV